MVHSTLHAPPTYLAAFLLQGDADVEELPADSMKRIRETYKQCRAVYQAMRLELAERSKQEVETLRASVTGGAKVRGGGRGGQQRRRVRVSIEKAGGEGKMRDQGSSAVEGPQGFMRICGLGQCAAYGGGRAMYCMAMVWGELGGHEVG